MTLREQLIRDEGYKTTIYYDTLNIPTIGVGFNLKEGLDNEEIDWILEHRLEKVIKEVLTRLPWVKALDAARQNAVYNMAYNMGVPRLLQFQKMLKALESSQWVEASNQILNSYWHTQVTARSNRIAKQIETGVMQ